MYSLDISGNRTILVAGVDALDRGVIVRMLLRLGYHVLHADCGVKARTIAERYRDPIHLLMTDIAMGDFSGPQLAHELRTARPALQVIYMAGRGTSHLPEVADAARSGVVIERPFATALLAAELHRLLQASENASAV